VELILNKMGLDELLRKELSFIENNYEPFMNRFHSGNGNYSESNNELNATQNNNFDIVSQLISALPPRTQAKYAQRNSVPMHTQRPNRSVIPEEKENADMSVRIQDEANNSKHHQQANNTGGNVSYVRKRKIDESILLELSKNSECASEPSVKPTAQSDEGVFKKPKLREETTNLLSKFMFEPKSDASSSANPPKQSESKPKEKLVCSQSTRSQKSSQAIILDDLNNEDFEIDLWHAEELNSNFSVRSNKLLYLPSCVKIF